ncbi:hypothetical protein MPK71_gp084 [Erwinia phage pEa_SNUABM_1]|uniref:Uncharacterized protein n=1 Tax=Erwinia phage pEa_SNUABM_1 TaxID=2869543 RepID=A0AAE7XN80_9CAUD|nr:hypothetical protein MPK71_gp084 [Erwinia phage pEa_SNUABM_1]QZE57293.1 hypothetical protein pEaSNUABM1_00084 [Erwinia phage pEa_SNUABM_1]
MISNKGLSLAQMNAAFPATAIVANGLHIGLFKGTAPKISKALDLMGPGTVNSLLNWSTIVTNLGLTSADFLGVLASAAITPIVNVNARTVTLPLAGQASTLTGIADGTPTFYVARILPANASNNWAGFNYSASLTGPFWIGSVGAQGSDAELQFIGGTIKTGQAYRFLDLTIQL